MKLIYFLLLISTGLLFTGCSKSNETAPPPVVPGAFDPVKATLLKQGSFTGNMSYAVSGSVKLYDFEGKKYIYFENFSTSSGPDLKVYVATTLTATQFVSLGALKGTTGTQVYQLTNPPDFNQFNKVLIWCQQFSVLFGGSTLL